MSTKFSIYPECYLGGFRSKENQKNKDDEEIELPVRMAFGITLTLLGLFIVCLPHPATQKAGVYLISSGVVFIADSGIDKFQEHQDERKNKKKENRVLKKYEEGDFDWKYWNPTLQRRI